MPRIGIDSEPMTTKTTTTRQDETDPAPAPPGLLGRLAPRADRGTHLLAAASLWSLVGIGLSVSGLVSILRSETGWAPAILLAAVALGSAKAHFVLFGTGSRIVERIERRGDGQPITGFLSWQSWLMVAGFILLGRALRATPMPEWLLGAIFLAVGVGLFLASLTIWRQWGRHRH